MTAADLKIAVIAFGALSATVAVNLLAMQDKRTGSAIETAALKQRPFEATVSAALNTESNQPSRAAAPKSQAAEPANIAEIIRGLQRELNQRGYEAGQPDGLAGLVTRAAIMAYEHDYGLPLSATPSQDLLSRIVLGSSAPAPARATADRSASAEAEGVIRIVESQLTALGYTPGKADGNFDEQSARAIREFEVDQKLPESGRISGPLVSRLINLQGNTAAQTSNQVTPAKPAKAAQATKAPVVGQTPAKPKTVQR